MLRVLIFLLITVCFCSVGCKKKSAVEPAQSASVKKEIQVEDITKENMEEELNNLEKQIEEEDLK